MPRHVDLTAPYDSTLGSALLRSATDAGIAVTAGGIYACTQSPRPESAAEVDRLEHDGCDIVGMTGIPEVALVREAGIAYAHLAIVVNAAAGRAPGPIRVEDMPASWRRRRFAALTGSRSGCLEHHGPA